MQAVRTIIQKIFAIILTLIAKRALRKYKPTIIAVTGNVGKTTTKDIIISMLSAHAYTRGTIRSQNTDLTTPLSIFDIEVQNKERNMFLWTKHVLHSLTYLLGSREFPRYLVLEVSAAGPGDITRQARWLRPDISVLTALQKMPVHLEFFDNREQLFEEKMQLVKYTQPDGAVVYNAGDEFLPDLLTEDTHRKIPVGANAKIAADSIIYSPEGVRANLKNSEEQILVPGVWGDSYIASVLLGAGVLQELGLDYSKSLTKLEETFTPIAGRMRVLQGKDGTTIIDDSYNASPIAVEAALDALAKVQSDGTKYFLFGDMYELGVFEESAHREIGIKAVEIADRIILVGEKTKITLDAITQSGYSELHVKHFENSDEAGFWLSGELERGDVVLAKSSRHAIKMEQALRHLVEKDQKQFLSQEYL